MHSNALLSNWRTSVGMTILGIVLGIAINCIGAYSYVSVNSDLVVSSTGSHTLALIVQLIVALAGIIYCVVAYQSYFTESPKVTSPGTVSLLNGLFGGIIFGCLWNANLTKRNKGISWIVFIVCDVIALIGCITALV